jgi:propionate CoA-transferase
VSKLGRRITGSGGFIDISQTAKKVVFCGTFTNGEIVLDTSDGKVRIVKDGTIKKFRQKVEQVTFSGEFAAQRGQRVLYVTERAVFELRDGKMVLIEIAPGIDLERDVLSQMEFVPEISSDLKMMDPAIFKPEKMVVTNPDLFSEFNR